MSRKKKSHTSDDETAQQADDTTAGQTEGDVEAAETDGDDLLLRLQRLSADYVNYQKRARRDLAQARLFANEDLIKSLLPVLDDMERALAAGKDNHEADDALLTGMQLVHDKALETLGRFGLKVIEAHELEFDPDRHTALLQQLSADHAPNTVLQVVQKGYELRGRTIRAAGVIVSKSPDEPQADEVQDGPEDGPTEATRQDVQGE